MSESEITKENQELKTRISEVKAKLLKIENRSNSYRGHRGIHKDLISEYLITKKKYQKAFNPEYLINIKNEVKCKEHSVKNTSQAINELKSRIFDKEKQLKSFARLPTDLQHIEINQLLDKNCKIAELSSEISEAITKEIKTNNATNIKKEKLVDKFTSLVKIDSLIDEKLPKLSETQDFRMVRLKILNKNLRNLNTKFENFRYGCNDKVNSLLKELLKLNKDIKAISEIIDNKTAESTKLKEDIDSLVHAMHNQAPHRETSSKSLEKIQANHSLFITDQSMLATELSPINFSKFSTPKLNPESKHPKITFDEEIQLPSIKSPSPARNRNIFRFSDSPSKNPSFPIANLPLSHNRVSKPPSLLQELDRRLYLRQHAHPYLSLNP